MQTELAWVTAWRLAGDILSDEPRLDGNFLRCGEPDLSEGAPLGVSLPQCVAPTRSDVRAPSKFTRISLVYRRRFANSGLGTSKTFESG